MKMFSVKWTDSPLFQGATVYVIVASLVLTSQSLHPEIGRYQRLANQAWLIGLIVEIANSILLVSTLHLTKGRSPFFVPYSATMFYVLWGIFGYEHGWGINYGWFSNVWPPLTHLLLTTLLLAVNYIMTFLFPSLYRKLVTNHRH